MARLALLLMVACLVGCASIRGNSPPRTELRGRILDPEGRGVEGVSVIAFPNHSYGHAWVTRRDGSYRARLSPGRYHIVISTQHQPVWEVDLDTIDVPLSGATLDYRYRGFKIRGRVRGRDGRLPEGNVTFIGDMDTQALFSSSGKITRGAYELFVPRGRYLVRWELRPPFPTIEPRQSFVVSSDTTIDLDLPWKEARGRIRVGGVESAWRVGTMGTFKGRDTLSVGGSVRVDSHGRYAAYLLEGEYEFFVSGGPEKRWVYWQRFHRPVPDGDPVQTNLRASTWTGTVRDSVTGAPLDSILVSAFDSRHFSSIYVVTDHKGRFLMLMDPNLVYTVNFWDSYRHHGRLGRRLSNVIAWRDTIFDVAIPGTP